MCLAPSALAQNDSSSDDREPLRTSVTIVERLETEAPALMTDLNRRELQSQPGVNLDDRLRSVPGFSLFRRSSSLVANPTTQGVSLRGLGSSGASRTLVLWDGIPLNDPFGGWIQWTRVAPDEMQRVEILRGAPVSVFGDRAMSGIIGVISRPPQPWRLLARYEAGNLGTHGVTAGGSHLWNNRFGASAHVRAFTTDGYYIVPESVRGSVDTRANVRFVAGNTRLDLLGRSGSQLFLRLDVLAEERDNGTQLTRNSTSTGTLAAHGTKEWSQDSISALAYHTRGEYRASFSAVTNNRQTERLTFLQTVPSEATGVAGFWRHDAPSWRILAGADVQHVEGTSTDRLFPTGIRTGGGSQTQQGTFAQINVGSSNFRWLGGARYQFAGGDSRFFMPSTGFTAGRGWWRLRGTVYRSFRAPTLNELFREFRVGNAQTQANPDLQPESMFGAEAGADLYGESGSFSVSLFRHELDDLITNVTLSAGPEGIVRQRRNAASALARGLDVSAEYRWRFWRIDLGYLYTDSRFSEGFLIPQVPKHSGNAQLTFFREGTLISAGLRSYASQFEDDLNRFLLPGFATLGVSARQAIYRSLSATFELENATGREYLVGFSPVPLIGAPRMVRVGLRWDGPVRR